MRCSERNDRNPETEHSSSSSRELPSPEDEFPFLNPLLGVS